MFIKDLARKPELKQVTLDDEDIRANYGDSVCFWMRDYVDINTYFEFFASQSEKNGEKLSEIMRRLILNEKGEPVLQPGEELPIDIMVGALVKINEELGKSKAKSSTQPSGEQ